MAGTLFSLVELGLFQAAADNMREDTRVHSLNFDSNKSLLYL